MARVISTITSVRFMRLPCCEERGGMGVLKDIRNSTLPLRRINDSDIRSRPINS